jgi:hypothetical protein
MPAYGAKFFKSSETSVASRLAASAVGAAIEPAGNRGAALAAEPPGGGNGAFAAPVGRVVSPDGRAELQRLPFGTVRASTGR